MYDVDGVATIIRVVHGNVAKGAILHRDMSTTPCYIVKQGGVYAHGRTLREAQTALMDKLLKGMPLEDRIAAFVAEHHLGQEYPNRDYFSWHHRLTGSCEAGRLAFARDHQVDLDGSMTVEEFIALTEHAYGGEVIRKLREVYEIPGTVSKKRRITMVAALAAMRRYIAHFAVRLWAKDRMHDGH